jgi:hypothetical protein
MFVELDLFSGRPNPRWQLNEVQATKLGELHSQLPAAAEMSPAPPGLGYRGFLYSLGSAHWRAW